MVQKRKEIVIPKDKAAFWLDKNGYWHNQHGRFEHRKIRDYFHACIRRDAGGYFLHQVREECIEKVYFPYEDTALFVFDVKGKGPLTLVLNTGKRIRLNPTHLFVKNDHLYVQEGPDCIKFSERSLMKISTFLDDQNARYRLRLGKRTYAIAEKSD